MKAEKKKTKPLMSGKEKLEKRKKKSVFSESDQQVEQPEVKKHKLEGEGGNNKDLSPEEKRTLERKLKKERKKEQKKLMRDAGITAKEVESKKPSASELALDYLTIWSKRPKDWKFQKTRQTWLLLHMYDKEKVPDYHFSILLPYLKGLQGRARDVTVQKAEALMKEYDGSEEQEDFTLEKCERIRNVLQLLS